MMAADPERAWSEEQLKNEEVPKKDLIKFIQDNAAHSVVYTLEPVEPDTVRVQRQTNTQSPASRAAHVACMYTVSVNDACV